MSSVGIATADEHRRRQAWYDYCPGLVVRGRRLHDCIAAVLLHRMQPQFQTRQRTCGKALRGSVRVEDHQDVAVASVPPGVVGRASLVRCWGAPT